MKKQIGLFFLVITSLLFFVACEEPKTPNKAETQEEASFLDDEENEELYEEENLDSLSDEEDYDEDFEEEEEEDNDKDY